MTGSAFSMLVQVVKAGHLAILEDWLEFFGRPPDEVVAVVPPEPGVAEAVRDFHARAGIPLALEEIDLADIKDREPLILRDQARRASHPWIVSVKLDTLPWRTGHYGWLEDVFDRLAPAPPGPFFLTGSTLPFRADARLSGTPYWRTGRVSDNFLIASRAPWLEIQELYRNADHPRGRYYAEGAVERFCRDEGAFGLRRMNAPDWRVFHVQRWDESMAEVRRAFRAGEGVAPFMRGWQDDLRHPWEKYYRWPSPPLHRRLRIRLGEWRRRLTGPDGGGTARPA